MYHRWEQKSGRDAFISLKVREMNAKAQEGCEPLPNTYMIKDRKGQDDCAPRFGRMVNIVIFTPLVRGVEKYIE